jgi:hypothetical protein
MSTTKAAKNVLSLFFNVIMLLVTVVINHLIVSHWGWSGYGKFNFWVSIVIGLFCILCYSFAFLVELL